MRVRACASAWDVLSRGPRASLYLCFFSLPFSCFALLFFFILFCFFPFLFFLFSFFRLFVRFLSFSCFFLFFLSCVYFNLSLTLALTWAHLDTQHFEKYRFHCSYVIIVIYMSVRVRVRFIC